MHTKHSTHLAEGRVETPCCPVTGVEVAGIPAVRIIELLSDVEKLAACSSHRSERFAQLVPTRNLRQLVGEETPDLKNRVDAVTRDLQLRWFVRDAAILQECQHPSRNIDLGLDGSQETPNTGVLIPVSRPRTRRNFTNS